MERLTEYEVVGGHVHAVPTGDVDQAMMRLAAYEDTGLTPEQCENAKHIIESAFSDDTSKAERIRELLKADKAGRLVVLPCKPGDTVYMISWRLNGRHEIEERVFGLTYFDPAKYGKDYFLTREEAEKALEAMQNE